MSDEKGFVEIASVLVNPEIFTRPYTCDVEKYGCSPCAATGPALFRPTKPRRIEKHLDGVLAYLSPENREAVRRTAGSWESARSSVHRLRHPRGRGPCHPEGLRGKDFRCVLLFNNDCALIYTTKDGLRYCSVHTYAMEKGMVWEEFKFADCVQYPSPSTPPRTAGRSCPSRTRPT